MKKYSHVFIVLVSLLTTCKAWAGEDSVYDFLWLDPDKSVYVLQNKVYRKEHTVSAEISFLNTLGSKFQDTTGFDLKAQYYISEHFGLELFYTSYSNSDSDDFKNVVYITAANNSGVATYPFVRRLKSAVGAMLLISPFYGKINTFNKIHYFDWSFGVGLAQIQAESNINSVLDVSAPNSYVSESFTALVYKTTFKFHMTRHWSFAVDLRNMNYQANKPQDKSAKEIKSNWDFMLGLGFKFN